MTAAERREKARLRSERWRRAHGIREGLGVGEQLALQQEFVD